MYLPKVFSVGDLGVIFRFIHAHSFGMLTVPRGDDPPEIAHLPFLLDTPPDDGSKESRGAATLRVHVARANPIWQLASTRSSTVVFAGPHTYVSPTWYVSPADHVPTWNYAVVHARCDAATILDDAALEAMLDDLSQRHEEPRRELGESTWRVDDIDPSFRQKLMRQIVGLSLRITLLEPKFKLSQNREPADRQRVMEQLERRGLPDDLAMLKWMKASV